VLFNTIAYQFDGAWVNDGILRVVAGRTGREVWSAADPLESRGGAGRDRGRRHRRRPRAEIVTGYGNGLLPATYPGSCAADGAIAFEADGTRKWISERTVWLGWGAPALADLDADGARRW